MKQNIQESPIVLPQNYFPIDRKTYHPLQANLDNDKVNYLLTENKSEYPSQSMESNDKFDPQETHAMAECPIHYSSLNRYADPQINLKNEKPSQSNINSNLSLKDAEAVKV